MTRKIKIFITRLCYLILILTNFACHENTSETKKDEQINILLDLVGTPNEFFLTPRDSLEVDSWESTKSILSNLSTVTKSLKNRGIANGNFLKTINKYSEFLGVKYWDCSIKDSGFKFLNISEVKKRLGKENSIEKGVFEGKNEKFSVLWYKYDWICFGVDDSSKIRAVRGIYSYPQRPYVRLNNNSIVEASLEPKLLLFETNDSSFIMLSSNSIKNIVRVPADNLQNNKPKLMYELENEPTRLIISKISKEAYNRSDLISFVYETLESKYNSPSYLGSYWMSGLPGEKDMISGVTYDEGVLKRDKFVAFTDSTLTIKDKSGTITNTSVSDFISFFQ